MSDVVERVAAVLAEHYAQYDSMSQDDAWHCHCNKSTYGGQPYRTRKEANQHVAVVVVAALGLAEEWAVEFENANVIHGRPQNRPPSAEMLERVRVYFPGRRWVSRWVSPWVGVLSEQGSSE